MVQGNRQIRVGLLFALFACLLTFAVRFDAAEGLPQEVSDDTFWNMIVEMSEPDGAFRFENFLSNELGYQYVIPRLLQTTQPGGVYIGVAPEQNFTYIAALKPQMAFIVDIRRQNMIELLMYKALFELSETRADFVARLFARKRPAGLTVDSTASEIFDAFERLPADRALFRENLLAMRVLLEHHNFALRPSDLEGISSLEYVYSAFFDAGPALDYTSGGFGGPNPTFADLMKIDDGAGVNRSFLATEENYRFIRDLQRRNLIVPLVGDFAGPKTLKAIGGYLKDRNATVTAFYLSNVEQYLFNDFRAAGFYENVETLPMNSGSTFIRSFSGGNGGAFRFLSTLSPMEGFIQAFRIGRVRQYGDVRDLSQ